MTSLPLLRHGSPDAVVALQDGIAIQVQEYLQDVHALARALPDRTHVANYCHDRYRFTVGLGAALLRRQITLLPPGASPGVLERMTADYPDAYVLADGALPGTTLQLVTFPELQRSATALPVPEFEADQPAVVLFTSGSTGTPVANPRSWGALVHSARAAGKRLLGDTLRSATVMATVPHQHSYGIESSVMLALQNGLALDTARPLLPGDIAAHLATLPRPRLMVTTPVHLKALASEPGGMPYADLILSATAPLALHLAKLAEATFGGALQEIYGCSEAGQIATRRTAETAEWQCLDGITLERLEAGTVPHGQAVAAEVVLPDVIELLSPERFLLHGRMADLVSIAGKRSSLGYLNHLLNAVSGVTDGVFLMPENDEQAHRLTALVVAPGLTREAILAALRHDIDPAFLPRPLIMVERLPRNELGKLPREALLELAQAGERS